MALKYRFAEVHGVFDGCPTRAHETFERRLVEVRVALKYHLAEVYGALEFGFLKVQTASESGFLKSTSSWNVAPWRSNAQSHHSWPASMICRTRIFLLPALRVLSRWLRMTERMVDSTACRRRRTWANPSLVCHQC